MGYLSGHCYNNEQQMQMARDIINKDINEIKKIVLAKDHTNSIRKGRENSSVIDELLGYRYQSPDRKGLSRKLPKRFTESLINDVTLEKIINGEKATYETLRKALMLFRFYRFYSEAPNTDKNSIDNESVILSGSKFSTITGGSQPCLSHIR